MKKTKCDGIGKPSRESPIFPDKAVCSSCGKFLNITSGTRAPKHQLPSREDPYFIGRRVIWQPGV